MRESALYIDGLKLPVTPARITFRLPAHSTKYELVETGEAELLQGARLAEIKLEGLLPAYPGYGATDIQPPQTYIDHIMSAVEDARPIRMIYVGQTWDVNMMCSIQNPEFKEVGGCFDIEYAIALRKWVEISAQTSDKTLTRKTTAPNTKTSSDASGKSYTVKENDTLSHIAKSLLGDSSRWREIYELNHDTIKNPNLIYTGQVINLPDDASGSVPNRSSSSSGKKTSTKKSSSASTQKNTSASSSSKAPSSAPFSPAQGVSNADTSYKTAADLYKQYSNQFSY